MSWKQRIVARPDLVKIAVAVVVLFFGAKYLMGDSARRAQAHAAEDRAEQANVEMAAALDKAAAASAARLESEAESARLNTALVSQRAAHGEIRRQAEDSIARLHASIEVIEAVRKESASDFRARLPEPLRLPFDQHEAIHHEELELAKAETEQVREELKASDALRVTSDSANVGLNKLVVDLRTEVQLEHDAKVSAIERGDYWEESSDGFKAVSERGLLKRLIQDVQGTLVAASIGVAVDRFLLGGGG